MQTIESDEMFDEKGHELSEQEQIQQMYEMQNHKRRPPQFEQMQAFVKSIVKKVDMVKGVRIEGSAGVSQNAFYSGAFTFPHQTQNKQKLKMNPHVNDAHFGFMGQYVGGDIRTPYDRPSIIMTANTEINSGRLDAQIIKQVTDNLHLKLITQFPNHQIENAHVTYEADYHGSDFNSNFKYNDNYQILNFSQKIGKGLSLGFELFNIQQRAMTLFNYALKYSYNNSIYYAQYHASQAELSLAFQHNLNKTTTMISNLEFNTATNESLFTLGYKQKFQLNEVTSTVNSKGKISSIFSTNAIIGLKLCAVANLIKNKYKFGIGIHIGQKH